MMQESHFVSDGEAGERAYGLFRRAFEFPWPPNLSIDNPGLDPVQDVHWLRAYNRFRELYQGRENGTLSRAKFNRQIREFSDNLMRDPDSPLHQGITVATLPSNIVDVTDTTTSRTSTATLVTQPAVTAPVVSPTTGARATVLSTSNITTSESNIQEIMRAIGGVPTSTVGYREHIRVVANVFAERGVNIITPGETLPTGATPVGNAFALADIIPAIAMFGRANVNDDHVFLSTDFSGRTVNFNEYGQPIARERSDSDTETELMRAFQRFYQENPDAIIDRSSSIPYRNISIQMYQEADGDRIAVVRPIERAAVVKRSASIVYNNDDERTRRR
ncbi:MAG: hypothetical protein ACOYJ2_02625 [Rickettsiales bacterium]